MSVSSLSMSRLWWNSFMAIVLYSLFLLIPFEYAFYRDLERRENALKAPTWSSALGLVLNSFCYLDILFKCFTGYRHGAGNYIVLNQSLIIRWDIFMSSKAIEIYENFLIRKYLRSSFLSDLLSTLPFISIFKRYFNEHDMLLINQSNTTLIMFHIAFILKHLRFASFKTAQQFLEDIFKVRSNFYLTRNSLIKYSSKST